MSETKINTEEIKITGADGEFTIEVDDQTETYRALLSRGRELKEDATDQEAFELALKEILEKQAEL